MIPVSMGKQSGHKTIYYYLVIKQRRMPDSVLGSMLPLSLLALVGKEFQSILLATEYFVMQQPVYSIITATNFTIYIFLSTQNVLSVSDLCS